MLIDKIPQDDADDRTEMGDLSLRFRWMRPTCKWFGLVEPCHCLPPEIWDRLCGAGRWKNYYPNQTEALADVSHAFVRWARETAGLPLPRHLNRILQPRFTWCKQ